MKTEMEEWRDGIVRKLERRVTEEDAKNRNNCRRLVHGANLSLLENDGERNTKDHETPSLPILYVVLSINSVVSRCFHHLVPSCPGISLAVTLYLYLLYYSLHARFL
ncbi:hypothetical protein E2C01_086856 [Portunus trituberculatus]|uniref:Uncharacterized protein n=1 Tax=Portunus trituberculatus TaxID=210409 RepID=A0A5B7JCJ0_PORTR|nr:hypothetical protein [Portunus trituberculatus]